MKKVFSVLMVAIICHEANRALCAGLGDFSQVAWEDAPEWQKTSAINGVEFTLANPDAPASANHESWLAQKEAEGWKYGAVKNPDLKEHPCFVPYDALPPEQQAKDHLFRGIVSHLAPFIGIGEEAPNGGPGTSGITASPEPTAGLADTASAG